MKSRKALAEKAQKAKKITVWDEAGLLCPPIEGAIIIPSAYAQPNSIDTLLLIDREIKGLCLLCGRKYDERNQIHFCIDCRNFVIRVRTK